MRRSRITWHGTMGDAVLFPFPVVVLDEIYTYRPLCLFSSPQFFLQQNHLDKGKTFAVK
jgi:hypothetical protein